MVVVWDTSRCGKSGEVSVIAKAHTDVDITRIKIAPFDDTRLEEYWKSYTCLMTYPIGTIRRRV